MSKSEQAKKGESLAAQAAPAAGVADPRREGLGDEDETPSAASDTASARAEYQFPRCRDPSLLPVEKMLPDNTILLLTNCTVWTMAKDAGNKPLRDVGILIGGGKILQFLSLEDSVTVESVLSESSPFFRVIDCSTYTIVPGIVDVHVHAIGGGGEAGPLSRTPESRVEDLVNGGITTLIGVLGTDSFGRSPEALLMKTMGLNRAGLTAYMWTGSYRVPCPTITNSVQADIAAIDLVLGAGEIAISDHRSSEPSMSQLTTLLADIRTAGMLSGKAAKLHIHLGHGEDGMKPLWRLLKEGSNIPLSALYPTHCQKNDLLVEQSMQWIADGGTVDVTAPQKKGVKTRAVKALLKWRAAGVDLSHVTVSSDSYGSTSKFDEDGHILKYSYFRPHSMLRLLFTLVKKCGWTVGEAMALMTCNPASFMRMWNKGRLVEGADADLLMLDDQLALMGVVSRGFILVDPLPVKSDSDSD